MSCEKCQGNTRSRRVALDQRDPSHLPENKSLIDLLVLPCKKQLFCGFSRSHILMLSATWRHPLGFFSSAWQMRCKSVKSSSFIIFIKTSTTYVPVYVLFKRAKRVNIQLNGFSHTDNPLFWVIRGDQISFCFLRHFEHLMRAAIRREGLTLATLLAASGRRPQRDGRVTSCRETSRAKLFAQRLKTKHYFWENRTSREPTQS